MSQNFPPDEFFDRCSAIYRNTPDGELQNFLIQLNRVSRLVGGPNRPRLLKIIQEIKSELDERESTGRVVSIDDTEPHAREIVDAIFSLRNDSKEIIRDTWNEVPLIVRKGKPAVLLTLSGEIMKRFTQRRKHSGRLILATDDELRRLSGAMRAQLKIREVRKKRGGKKGKLSKGQIDDLQNLSAKFSFVGGNAKQRLRTLTAELERRKGEGVVELRRELETLKELELKPRWLESQLKVGELQQAALVHLRNLNQVGGVPKKVHEIDKATRPAHLVRRVESDIEWVIRLQSEGGMDELLVEVEWLLDGLRIMNELLDGFWRREVV
jgi:hypothetical protein